jgi:uncharacterized membrane protein
MLMLVYPTQQPGKHRLKHIFYYLFSGVSFLSATAAVGQSHKIQPSSFTARLINIEAASNETFRYNAKLHNGTIQSHAYDLNAQVPEGWNVAFKAEGSQVSSLNLDSNKTQDISIEINAAPQVKPGKYTVPVTAIAGQDTIRLNLEAVVKGTRSVELTTPNGRLSDEVTEGSHKEIHLVVKNTGSLTLDNLELAANAPSKWDATFAPSKIEHLEAGQTQDVVVTLSVPDKTLAGDYMATFSAKNTSSNASASLRITVVTSLLSGWIGLLVILLAIGIVWYLIRKYGRR